MIVTDTFRAESDNLGLGFNRGDISYHIITFFLGWYCVLLEVRLHNKISDLAFYSKIIVLIFPDLYFNGNLE